MIHKAPLVSILMNSYNSEKYLEETLDSVKNQNYDNWEIIFIDNHSTDNSSKIAKGFDERLKYFKTPSFCKLGEARNFGLTKVSGESQYLTFLDTDDIWLSDKLTDQISLLEGQDFALVYSAVEYINEESECLSTTSVSKKPSFDSLIKRYDINMQTVMLNLAVIDRNEIFFDRSLSYNPDFNLFLHLAYKYKILSTDKISAKYRIVYNSLSNQLNSIQVKENIKVLNRLYKLENLSCDKKKLIIRQKKYYYLKSVLQKKIKNQSGEGLLRCFLSLCFFNIKYFVLIFVFLLPNDIMWSIINRLNKSGRVK